jgi:Phage integrase, N-terminal SAM-like domain
MIGKTGRRQFGSVRKLPSGRWQVRYRHPITGKEHTGPDPFATKADAVRYLSGVEVDLDRGAWRDPKLGKMTFAVWADAYMRGAVHKRATTVATNDSNLKNHLIPVFGPMPFALIRPLDVRRFVEGMVAAGLAPSTIRTVYAFLRAVMNAAVDQEIVVSSPCRGVQLPKKTRGDMKVLTAEQLKALAVAIDSRYTATGLPGRGHGA